MEQGEVAAEGEPAIRHGIKNAAAATMAAADLLANHRDRLDDAQVADVLARIHHRGGAIIRMVDELATAGTVVADESSGAPTNPLPPVPPAHDHHLLFHHGPADLVERLTEFVLDGLDGGEAVVVVATRDHEERLCRSLSTRGVPVEALRRSGRLQLGGAEATLAAFMQGSRPGAAAFDAVVGNLVRHAVSRWHEVRIYGEMVALLWQQGEVGAALELEDHWNRLREGVAFHLLCGYPAHVAADPHGSATVRARHGAEV